MSIRPLFIFILWLSGSITLGTLFGKWLSGITEQASSSNQLEQKNNTLSRRAPTLTRVSPKSRTTMAISPGVFSGKKGDQLFDILNKLQKGEVPENWDQELHRLRQCAGLDTAALIIFFSKWAEVDFQTALEKAGKLPAGAIFVKGEIFYQLIERDPKEALYFYEKNKELLSNYGAVLGAIIRNLAPISPEEALNRSLKSKSKLGRDHLLKNFMQGIGFQNKETKNYMDKIYRATGEIPPKTISEWIQSDSASAEKWLSGLSFSFEDNRDISFLVGELGYMGNYKKALDTAKIMSDPELKERSISYTLKTWKEKNPTEFERWIQQPENLQWKEFSK